MTRDLMYGRIIHTTEFVGRFDARQVVEEHGSTSQER